MLTNSVSVPSEHRKYQPYTSSAFMGSSLWDRICIKSSSSSGVSVGISWGRTSRSNVSSDILIRTPSPNSVTTASWILWVTVLKPSAMIVVRVQPDSEVVFTSRSALLIWKSMWSRQITMADKLGAISDISIWGSMQKCIGPTCSVVFQNP